MVGGAPFPLALPAARWRTMLSADRGGPAPLVVLSVLAHVVAATALIALDRRSPSIEVAEVPVTVVYQVPFALAEPMPGAAGGDPREAEAARAPDAEPIETARPALRSAAPAPAPTDIAADDGSAAASRPAHPVVAPTMPASDDRAGIAVFELAAPSARPSIGSEDGSAAGVRRPARPKPRTDAVSPRDTGVSPAPPTPSRKPAPPASVASSAEGDLGQSGSPAPVSLEQARGPASSQTAAGPSGATRGVAVLARFDPIYPAAALRRRLEGDVTLQIEIDERGSLEHAGVIRSSGYNILDEAAVAAVHKWTFAPAVEDGRPKRANAELPISFRIGAR